MRLFANGGGAYGSLWHLLATIYRLWLLARSPSSCGHSFFGDCASEPQKNVARLEVGLAFFAAQSMIPPPI